MFSAVVTGNFPGVVSTVNTDHYNNFMAIHKAFTRHIRETNQTKSKDTGNLDFRSGGEGSVKNAFWKRLSIVLVDGSDASLDIPAE